ncbi:MAG: hypothetical protein L0220_31715 [Acidobacteria bacterium]|nr:hypothetical protein [Acidobacteriota bacterium]
MSRVIEYCNSKQSPALKLRQLFKTLAIVGSLAVLPLTAYPQTISVVTQQETPTEPKVQAAYVLLNTAGDVARHPDLSSLDIPLLIRDSDRMGTAMHLRLPEYTYIQTRLSREFNDRGKLIEHKSAFEAYPLKVLGHHRHVISLISEDGVPLSPKRLKEERLDAAKEIEAAERESVPQAGGSFPARAERYVTAGIGLSQAGDGVWVGVSQFLQKCSFNSPRYDRLGDRDMIALNIHSCAGNASAPRERYMAEMSGVIWIDAVDKVVARLEAWPMTAEPAPELRFTTPEAETIVYEQMRLQNGLWVPKRIRLNAIGKAALFNGIDRDMTFEFSIYQHYNTEVEDLQQVTLQLKP